MVPPNSELLAGPGGGNVLTPYSSPPLVGLDCIFLVSDKLVYLLSRLWNSHDTSSLFYPLFEFWPLITIDSNFLLWKPFMLIFTSLVKFILSFFFFLIIVTGIFFLLSLLESSLLFYNNATVYWMFTLYPATLLHTSIPAVFLVES